MELRKDYVLDRWVIISTERKNRPHEFKVETVKTEGVCYFCQGNEHLTPPEIGRVSGNNSWKFRWFANKFPAVKPEGYPVIQTHNEFFTFAAAYGNHEVIVDTSDHGLQLWDLSADDMGELFKVYNSRIAELSAKPNTEYVVVFKNHGQGAGTSLVHSHTQVVSLNFVPESVKRECKAYYSSVECPYCKIISTERQSYRRCFENDCFVAFTPYASRFPYEIWVFPKKHVQQMGEFRDKDYYELADIMKKILSKLKQLNAPYNFFIHYSPSKDNLHFHIEITPRLATWAGFEYSTDTIINPVSPEDAARFYRGEEVI
jgi:UDPglucose--hexose-1-phosphate uridylyltransferase